MWTGISLHGSINKTWSLSASFDGAWQKRVTGRAYNSLTGHASLFGEKSKKIISFSVKGKECRICAAAKSKGRYFDNGK
uniref:Mutator-like transposase domain-containing protein n=1 Tax=Magallana gigas TaxID=29159 RepID=A0A8W8LRA9_MAGGI